MLLASPARSRAPSAILLVQVLELQRHRNRVPLLFVHGEYISRIGNMLLRSATLKIENESALIVRHYARRDSGIRADFSRTETAHDLLGWKTNFDRGRVAANDTVLNWPRSSFRYRAP